MSRRGRALAWVETSRDSYNTRHAEYQGEEDLVIEVVSGIETEKPTDAGRIGEAMAVDREIGERMLEAAKLMETQQGTRPTRSRRYVTK